MRYYVTTDVHGHFSELQTTLTEQGFFEDHEPHSVGSAARFAVPGVRLAYDAAALHTDRCTLNGFAASAVCLCDGHLQ